MRNHKIGGLPVVSDGQLVGIVTDTDLLDFLIELLEHTGAPA
jgi:acetoin utilization protein AcuB